MKLSESAAELLQRLQGLDLTDETVRADMHAAAARATSAMEPRTTARITCTPFRLEGRRPWPATSGRCASPLLPGVYRCGLVLSRLFR